MLIMHYTHNYFHRRVTFHIVPRINDIQHEAHIFESITGLRHDRHNNFTIIENKMMDNCNTCKQIALTRATGLTARGDTGPAITDLSAKNCYCMFLAFQNKLRQKTLPIFFIENIEFGVILISETLDVVIQIFYRFVRYRESLQC